MALLHLTAVGFAFGPWHGKYLLLMTASGVLLWGMLPALLPLRRWKGLLIGAIVALMVRQAAFWFWRVKLGGIGWPLVQFASVHLVIGLAFGRVRYRRPSTFVWRGTMINPCR